jgi:hypothetical protein
MTEAKKFVWHLVDQYRGDVWTDMAGFNQREEEEFLLIYGPRKVRKAIKARRKLREQSTLSRYRTAAK